MEKRYLSLKDVDAYRQALVVSNLVWAVVQSWDCFARNTIGEQFVRSADSVSANIAEGFGRYSKKDKIKFYRYANGSLKESLDWTLKARMRRLLSKEQYEQILGHFQSIPSPLYRLINFTNLKLKI